MNANQSLRILLSCCACGAVAACGAAQPDVVDPRVRTYVYPTRVMWRTECQTFDDGWPVRREALQMEKLLETKHGQVSEGYFGSPAASRLVNRGEPPGVLLDFGRELQGGVQIGICKKSSPGARLRLRFGESAGEAMSALGDGKHACNDHSIRDLVLEVPRFGSVEIGQTAFRFLRIDLVTGGEVGLEFVRAVSLMRPMAARGAFRCSDERLNRVFETAVRTLHLCCQDHLWDGIKRDRLVWIGDMYFETLALLAVYGDDPVLRETLDYEIATTPPDKWMVMPTYTLSWIRILAALYRFNGDADYIRRHGGYLRATLANVEKKLVGADGRTPRGGGFLDWPTHHSREAEAAGTHALCALAFDDAADLLAVIGDTGESKRWRARAAAFRSVAVDPANSTTAATLLANSGQLTPRQAFDTVLGPQGLEGVNTFYGGLMLDVMSRAGEGRFAQRMARDYWGGMLDVGATSFWEDFRPSWTNGCTRIDELPQPGRRDVHGDNGEFCFPGFRCSLCHGCGSGVAAWCINRVLGLRPLDVGCRTVEVAPDLGDLEWAEGALALPDGRAVRVRVTRGPDGTPRVKVDAPEGVRTVVKRAPPVPATKS